MRSVIKDTKKINLIIFDLDGILIDSTLEIAFIVNCTLKKNGYPERSLEFYTENIGSGISDLLKKSLPKKYNEDWIIWAGWADRITIEEIEKKTGKNESQVIKIMRKNLKSSSFRLWRKRVHKTSIKHRKKFKLERKKMREKIRISDIY